MSSALVKHVLAGLANLDQIGPYTVIDMSDLPAPPNNDHLFTLENEALAEQMAGPSWGHLSFEQAMCWRRKAHEQRTRRV